MEKEKNKVYRNRDCWNYLLKMDRKDSPLHQQYQSLFRYLLRKGLHNPISDETLAVFSSLFSPELSSLLTSACEFQRVTKNEDGSYSVYPKLQGLPGPEDFLKYYCFDLKMSEAEMILFLESHVEEWKEKLKSSKLQNYYGDPKYLILRTKAILGAMYMLKDNAAPEDRDLAGIVIANTELLFHSMLDTMGVEDTEEVYETWNNITYRLKVTKEQYDLLRSNYVKVLEHENQLMDISRKIWQSYAWVNHGVFVHQLTGGVVESDEMVKICACFYSDNANIITAYKSTTNDQEASTGYAYPMDIDSLLSVCETDVGSWYVTKEEFIERGLPEGWQIDDTHLFYEYPHHSKLFPPQYIEEQVLKKKWFAEIVIDNRHPKVSPLYCFYTASATPEQIQEIHEIAAKQGLEVKFLKTNPLAHQIHK